jgi:hypothetical protein
MSAGAAVCRATGGLLACQDSGVTAHAARRPASLAVHRGPGYVDVVGYSSTN